MKSLLCTIDCLMMYFNVKSFVVLRVVFKLYGYMNEKEYLDFVDKYSLLNTKTWKGGE